MAGKSSKTEVITLRVPIALAVEWREAAKAGGVTVGSLVVDLAKRGGRLSAEPIPAKALAAFRGDPSKPGPLREGLPGYRLTKSAVDPKVHHPSGPVLKSAVPKVRGEATGFNLKTKGKR